MRPVTTFLRHKLIVGIIGAAKLIHKATKGKRPKFLFMANTPLKDMSTGVKIVEEDDTSITIAKYRPDGSIDDGEFKIMTATDMHMGAPGAELNNKSIQMLVKQIEKERPDLVVFTGDIILSDCQQTDAVQFSMMMEKLGVYWCYAFGNHEAREEKEYFKYLLYKGLMYCPHSLCRFVIRLCTVTETLRYI